jgi:fructose-1,6-bisphosphatase II
MDRNLALELVRVTEAAALAAARWMGKGDAIQADHDAFESARLALQSIRINGEVAVGRVALSGDASLAPGAALTTDDAGTSVDLALDPVECIHSVATGRSNAMSVVALGEQGAFLRCGDLYMDKIAVGPQAAGSIDMNASPLENLVNIASAKRCYVEELTVSILDRTRHRTLVQQIREAGARIHLIEDGDLAAAVATAVGDTGVDVVMGTGTARVAMLAAAALGSVGGDLQGRFVPLEDAHKPLIAEITAGQADRVYGITELVGTQVMFAATGITEGDILQGVHFRKGGATTHSIVTRQRSGTVRYIRTQHSFERKPQY